MTNAAAFGLAGFTAHADIVAGGFFDVFVSFDTSMPLGDYIGEIRIHSLGHNVGVELGEALPNITLTLHAEPRGCPANR